MSGYGLYVASAWVIVCVAIIVRVAIDKKQLSRVQQEVHRDA
jgi:heme exporter protein D